LIDNKFSAAIMERKNIRLRRDESLRTKFIKSEYKYHILKSIIKTRTLSNMTRFYAYSLIQKQHVFLGRWKNFCLLTGRARGTTKLFNISRHALNKLAQQGGVTGFTRNNYK
jgi:ribosomal protein S14